MTNHPFKPVIFLAFANDRESGNSYLRQLNNEAAQLRQLLEGARQICELVIWQNATLDDILDFFQKPEYKHRIALFHFGGHANSYNLLFEARNGKAAPVDAAGLAKFLSQQRGLALVFLNGCETEAHVQGLLAAGVKAVIATSQKIADETALDFAVNFYKALLSSQRDTEGLQTAFIAAEGATQARVGAIRRAYLDEADFGEEPPQAWPWKLYPTPLPDQVVLWNLARAANDPYFGLPELPPRPLPPCPFLGLSYFQEKHAGIFFGRGRQIRELFSLITDETLSANPILLLYGQSGVGKSSLLAAGLLPRLKQVCEVRYIRREEAGNNLIMALQQALAPCSEPCPEPVEGDPSEDRPTGPMNPDPMLSLRERWLAYEAAHRPLVLIIDQVEEIYTRPGSGPAGEMAGFLQLVAAIFGPDFDRWPQGKLILSFRKEWLAEIRDRLAERALPYKEVFLKHLDRPGIIEAITGPATSPRLSAHYELAIANEAPQVSDLIADDLLADRGSAIAPTLQIILTKLWENATGKPKVFNQKLYDELRLQPANFLDQLLDQQLAGLAEKHPAESASGLVLDLLTYHTTSYNTTKQRNKAELEKNYAHLLPQVIGNLVKSCTDHYLLVDPSGDVDEEAPTATRLSHDTLGPLVCARFDASNAPGQQARRILENRTPQENPGPLDEIDLTLVEAGRNGMRAWTEPEQRLVELSRKARARRRRERVIQWVFAIFAILLITVAAIVAEQRRQDAAAARIQAEQQARINRAGELAALAVNELDEDPEAAILLAMEAVTTTYNLGEPVTIEAEQALHQAVQTSPIRYTLPGNRGGIWAMAFNPKRELLATAGLDQSIRWWRFGPEGPLEILPPLPNITYTSAVAFDPEGTYLAVGNAAGQAELWDIATSPPQLQGTFPLHERWITDMTFSPDGKTLATVGLDGKAKLLEVATGQEKDQLEFEHRLCGVAFSPDGAYVALGGDRGIVTVWQVATGRLTDYVHDEAGTEVCAVAFSPTADFLLATGGADRKARLWQPDRAQPLHTLDSHTNTIRRIAFSPDGERLITAGFDQTAKLWEANSGRLLSTFSGHKALIRAVAMSGDGQYLITAGDDETVKIWAAGSYHQGPGNTVAFAPNGNRLASTSSDGTVRLWLPSGRQMARYDDGAGTTWNAVFYPDSVHLATVAQDGWLRVRNTSATGQPLTQVPLVERDLSAVAINPAGTLLAAAGAQTVFILNPQTGEQLTSIPAHQSQIVTLAFHPTQNLLASGGIDGQVQLIDLNTYQIIKSLKSARQTVQALAFSPTGHYLAAASGYNLITVWETETGREAFRISGHDDLVSSLAFTPDGHYLITAGLDQMVKTWDISTIPPGETLETPRLTWRQPAPVNGLALSPDGKVLVTIDEAGQLHFLPFLLDIEPMLELAKARVTTGP